MTSVAESNAISRLLRWVTGTGTGITTEQAREAAGFLASRSYRVLSAGITPAEVAGNWPAQPLPELAAEVKQLKEQLGAPCGSCHPCANYADETWRAVGRKPPHAREWDELNARVKAALDLIAEHDGPEAQHSEHHKWVSVRQALTGEAAT